MAATKLVLVCSKCLQKDRRILYKANVFTMEYFAFPLRCMFDKVPHEVREPTDPDF